MLGTNRRKILKQRGSPGHHAGDRFQGAGKTPRSCYKYEGSADVASVNADVGESNPGVNTVSFFADLCW